MVFKNKSYCFLFISAILSIGIINFISVVLGPVSQQYDFDTQEATVVGICFIMFGLIGSGVFSTLTIILKKYKVFCVISIVSSIVGLFLCYICLIEGSFIGIVFILSITGFTFVPIITISLEFGCEISFPVKEIVSSGLINCFGSLFSVFPILLAYFFDNQGLAVFIIMIVCQIISFAFIIFVKEELNRTKNEKVSPNQENDQGNNKVNETIKMIKQEEKSEIR